MSDGCTWWPDGWFGEKTWYECCVQHDLHYVDGTVNWGAHIELGQCVAGTTGGLLMGVVMLAGVGIWYLITQNQKRRHNTDWEK